MLSREPGEPVEGPAVAVTVFVAVFVAVSVAVTVSAWLCGGSCWRRVTVEFGAIDPIAQDRDRAFHGVGVGLRQISEEGEQRQGQPAAPVGQGVRTCTRDRGEGYPGIERVRLTGGPPSRGQVGDEPGRGGLRDPATGGELAQSDRTGLAQNAEGAPGRGRLGAGRLGAVRSMGSESGEPVVDRDQVTQDFGEVSRHISSQYIAQLYK